MKRYSRVIAVFSLMLLSLSSYAQNNNSFLLKGFVTPPNAAKPRVWWHWMNGNVTKDGIAKDLAWMKRAGIGGFQNFDAGLTTPQIVEKRLIYMTPEWKDAFLFTTKLADSLGLEMAIAGSPGWSESGGPWVTPAQAMKKLVWSEIRVKGGQTFNGTLPKPPTTTGAFQNIGNGKGPEYYADAAVVAYRVPENDITMAELQPKITSSGGNFDLTALSDGDLAKTTLLPAAPQNEKSWIQFEFTKPEKIQSITIVVGDQKNSGTRVLETSDDGSHFKTVMNITGGRAAQNTITFPPVSAKFFRVVFTTQVGTQIAELVLHTTAQVNRFEDKAGFTSASGIYALATPSVSTADIIKKDAVIDLTSKMQPDGSLNWTPPAGRWAILRLGYSLTGKTNHPASPEATGLEVDKLNQGHVKAYFENYLDQYKDATGNLMGKKGLQYLITDSWEAGTLNWTDSMVIDFKNHRGYDILPWLPVLTGHIVENAEASDRFLWDFRKTIADLTVENHYDQLTTLLHERGMGRYTESHEGGRVLVADGMDVKRKADVPMSATWTPREPQGVANVHKADVRESASVAHIYGQNLVAAESMTARDNAWGFSPERLKPTADMELASGLNRFVIHTSVHQPVDDKIPGLGLAFYGQWFNRHETWAEQALPWTTYLARSSYMLQQGKFVADVIYYYGEDNNITSLYENKLPNIPEGYDFDFVNADALLNLLSVNNKQIVTPSGMHYKVLVLDSNSMQMTLNVARKIRDLVKAGAIIAGPKPTGTPSLSDDKTAFNAIVDEVWGGGNSIKTIGSGKVFTGQSIKQVLEALKISPDFEYTKSQGNTELLYVHRKLPTQEFYWISNRNDRVENVEANFRVTGKSVEIWHPETGKVEQASYAFANGRTKVPLHLEPNDAVFVVFGENTTKATRILPKPMETLLTAIDGNWNLNFQKDRGAPAEIAVNKLASWADNTDAGIKYFSGTGTYSKKINASASWLKKDVQLWIDLGDVKNIAEVIVNGKSSGIVWKKPFRVNITGALKPGENTLVIKVTNLWVNRLIGDQQPGIEKKYTYTTRAFYKADSPLLPSGLIGPVRILSVQ